MSKNKYFVVVKGKKPGLYTSSKLATAQTSGVKGSRLFAFKTQEEAEACMIEHNVEKETPQKVVKQAVQPKPVISEVPVEDWYVDGAYFPASGQGYYGIAHSTIKDYGTVPEKYSALESYGAELYACKRAIELAFANDVRQIQIYSDNLGVVRFIKNNCSKLQYQEAEQEMKYFFDVISQVVDIEIEHINVSPNKSCHKKAHLLCQHGRLFLPV